MFGGIFRSSYFPCCSNLSQRMLNKHNKHFRIRKVHFLTESLHLCYQFYWPTGLGSSTLVIELLLIKRKITQSAYCYPLIIIEKRRFSNKVLHLIFLLKEFIDKSHIPGYITCRSFMVTVSCINLTFLDNGD